MLVMPVTAFPAEVISHDFGCTSVPVQPAHGGGDAGGPRHEVSHETVRQWALKFGQARQSDPPPSSRAGDKWHLDEVVISIAGRKHWLWRAVDQHGVVLDMLVQSRRNTKAAKRLLRKLLRRQGMTPRVMITDKLASYAAAKREVMPGVEHRQHEGLEQSR